MIVWPEPFKSEVFNQFFTTIPFRNWEESYRLLLRNFASYDKSGGK